MRNEDIIRILTFHGLGTPGRDLPDGEIHYWLEVVFFESIMDLVKGRADVRITFDDSNESDFGIALPALEKRGLRATFFVVSERIGKPGFLTAEQIRQMVRVGMTIGSHGTRHRRWASLEADNLRDELHTSRSSLEQVTGGLIREAACPYGSYNRRVLRALRVAGYERVFTSDQGPATRKEWISARNTIVRSYDLPYVENVLESELRGLAASLRMLKLLLKRWR